jgi:hypothetical protein
LASGVLERRRQHLQALDLGVMAASRILAGILGLAVGVLMQRRGQVAVGDVNLLHRLVQHGALDGTVQLELGRRALLRGLDDHAAASSFSTR